MRPSRENARGIVEASRYLVLATADAEGRPWSTPVYFAHAGCRDFFWVSSPEAVHSRNIAVRPEVGIVVFDSSAEIGTGQGVYMSAVAEEVVEGAEEVLEVYSRRTLLHGGRVWTLDDVRGASGMRLYRAAAESHSMLAKDGRPDHRVRV
ncbi:pyridoxamine 5'-phosphate oxidase family protein [Streptomyces griseorubiginosus]|uniref:pyridoxamine 5'-phosphate oxidase family protein n=1 Tax=Streptomyces griseorubiginosus TaxID=67304 RepID=UPI002E81C331|nr:pyridoxamine 5'-phosphate oxidase family protein [Streptomyces griseorubiginosus]WUB47460.1 pyridoxamine 5'-phosphate oxidase family protein [Streptomyces griseorubiginosus]WUB55985.1 pyridoxamine 5'-phosphate oxidase family protein [Streptomyces griseorubiginosus]